MKTLIKEFNARKEQSSKKAVISRVLEDINNACILALSVDRRSDSATQFFDDFVAALDFKLEVLVRDLQYYEQNKENSEVSDEKA